MKKHILFICFLLMALTMSAQKNAQGRHQFRLIYDDDGNSNCLFNCLWNRGPLEVWQVTKSLIFAIFAATGNFVRAEANFDVNFLKVKCSIFNILFYFA